MIGMTAICLWGNNRSIRTRAGVTLMFCAMSLGAIAQQPINVGALAKVATPISSRSQVASFSKPTWTDSNCGQCHNTDPLFSHPVQVRPSMQVPDHLPLENGMLTCVTCHSDSQWEDHTQARLNHTSLLRTQSNDTLFCNQCHNRSMATSQDAHAQELQIAHLKSPSDNGFSSRRESDTQDLSNRCLSCHDGVMASGGEFNISFGGISSRSTTSTFGAQRGQSIGNGHPVGIRYDPNRKLTLPGSNGAALASIFSLDRRIRLYDGKVGCGSCHSPYSQLENLLVITNYKSEICFSCHEM